MNASQADPGGRERLLIVPRLELAFFGKFAEDCDILHVERGVDLAQMPAERLSGIRAVLTSGPVGFTRKMFAVCPDILAVITFGTGTDRVDMETVRRRGARLASGSGVNVARGSVVDTEVLIRALRAEEIAGAALDVFDSEPGCPAELCELQNVLLTPHVAGNSVENRAAMFARAQANLTAFFAGQSLPGAVEVPLLSGAGR
jgi:lactate dehydrogenase-like 2-hydroxyacid dehydrogenase